LGEVRLGLVKLGYIRLGSVRYPVSLQVNLRLGKVRLSVKYG
jgi:hypothetical protein